MFIVFSAPRLCLYKHHPKSKLRMRVLYKLIPLLLEVQSLHPACRMTAKTQWWEKRYNRFPPTVHFCSWQAVLPLYSACRLILFKHKQLKNKLYSLIRWQEILTKPVASSAPTPTIVRPGSLPLHLSHEPLHPTLPSPTSVITQAPPSNRQLG